MTKLKEKVYGMEPSNVRTIFRALTNAGARENARRKLLCHNFMEKGLPLTSKLNGIGAEGGTVEWQKRKAFQRKTEYK